MIQAIDYELKGYGIYTFEIRTGNDRHYSYNNDPELMYNNKDFYPLLDRFLMMDIVEKATLLFNQNKV